MNAAQAESDLQSCFQGIIMRSLASYGVHNECDVVWHPAEEEDSNQGQDNHDVSLCLEASGAALEPEYDRGAAYDQTDCGQQEAQYVVTEV